MTPDSELSRLFAQAFPEIPKPAPLAPIDPVDADEAVNGICVEGDEA
ncbi:hypothetical protein [Stenotrophomonas sp. 278]|nr:hypothetical protein [Stenotrophomonas sp. 278]